MKKLFFALALITQTALVSAATPSLRPAKATLAYAKYENVNIFQQPGTSSVVLKALKSTEAMIIVRKFNKNWTIVTVGDKVGYVLTSELVSANVQEAAAPLASK